MNNLDVIAAVEKHQDNPMVHPLTCGNDSEHQYLVAFEDKDKSVKLKCLDCNYIQDWIPECILKGYEND